MVIFSGGACGAAAYYAHLTSGIWTEMHEQNRHNVDVSERPWVLVRMPDSIHLEVGQPIETTIEIFNYSHGVPAMVSTSAIRVEEGHGVIETFRTDVRPPNHLTNYLAPDIKGNGKWLIPAYEGRKINITASQEVLNRQAYDRIVKGIADGTDDVAVFGRLWYSGLGNPSIRYDSIFCFYLLKDRSVSACTDEQKAYTNYMP